MHGDPAEFEAIGSRLGFRVVEATPEKIRLVWKGPRFPAFLSLGIAVALLSISLPIVYAIQLRGFTGPAGALWYFPVMNLILFAVAVYLISQKRMIVVDKSAQRVVLTRRSFVRARTLAAPYSEISKLTLGVDRVYSGFAVAGSSAAQSFPVPALRLVMIGGESVLLDRGSTRRLKELGERLASYLTHPLEIEADVGG